jgi:hypothetical protein
MTRPPVFELHILPMIRASDREHMLFSFDMWDYDSVVAHASEIATRVAVDMPTAATGGPWPAEWVALFQRWRDTGFKRLQLGTAQYTRSQINNRFVVTGTGTKPSAQHRAWLQVESETSAERTYVLYVEAPDSATPDAPVAFTVRERYPALDARRVFVRDAVGTHEVALTPAPSSLAPFAAATDRAFWGIDEE